MKQEIPIINDDNNNTRIFTALQFIGEGWINSALCSGDLIIKVMIDLFQQSTLLVEFKGNVRLIQNTHNSTIFGIHGILVSGQGLEREDSLKL